MSTLALVMIARDESRCIERALRSAALHVDELCMLDTGSADDTPALAANCGAKVAHAHWSDDFAAARNAALALTDCDWRLVLDADEWLAGGTDCLHALRAGGGAPPSIGLVCVASTVPCRTADGRDAGEDRSVSWLPRLLPRGVLYEGRVHEQPASELPRQRWPLCIGHDGYQPEQMARKAGRNRLLLQRALHERPDDAYLHYQLGKDHEVHGEVAAAAPCYERAFAGVPAQAAWRHDLVLRLLYTWKRLRRFDEAFALAQAEAPHWTHSPDFFFTLGDLGLDWACAQPARAGELLSLVESSWTRALAIGENPALPDSVAGRGSWLAAHNLAVLHDGLGRSELAHQWRERSAQLRAQGAGRRLG